MIDQAYATSLNSSLIKAGAAEEASNQLRPNNMQRLVDNFSRFDPYVQAILIQSVVFLSDQQYSQISEDYQKLIEFGKASTNDWLKRTATRFENYPNISHLDEQIHIEIPEGVGKSFISTSSEVSNTDPIHFRLSPENTIKPPSASLRPPQLFKPSNEVKQATTNDTSLANLKIDNASNKMQKPMGQKITPKSSFGNRNAQNTSLFAPKPKAKKKQVLEYDIMFQSK